MAAATSAIAEMLNPGKKAHLYTFLSLTAAASASLYFLSLVAAAIGNLIFLRSVPTDVAIIGNIIFPRDSGKQRCDLLVVIMCCDHLIQTGFTLSCSKLVGDHHMHCGIRSLVR